MRGNEAISRSGQIHFESLEIFMKPNSTTRMQVRIRNLQHFGNQEVKDMMFTEFMIEARECTTGEAYQDNLACVKCPFGSYSYEVMKKPGECKPCPSEAICYGGDKTAPKPGYWRSEAYGETFTKCLMKSHCLGGNETEPLGICEEGYTGILC